jgi:hypothetical protein
MITIFPNIERFPFPHAQNSLFISKEDVLKAMNEIEIVGSFSGLLINRNKTEGVWIGNLKNCKYKIPGINWTDKPIKSLGIYFGNNNEINISLSDEGDIIEFSVFY